MKICAVVSEYNPFHLGHAYHIKETRRILGGDVAVAAVMSGNFVQRGDFALLDKFRRAEAALAGGADIVIELPTVYAVSSAERFASGAIALLKKMGITGALSFGCECGDIKKLLDAANILKESDAKGKISRQMKTGQSYAAARQSVAEEILGADAQILKSPNNVLGIEYLKALAKENSSLFPVAVKRAGAGHDCTAAGGFSSASYIRRLVCENSAEAYKYMTPKAAEILKKCLENSETASIDNAEQAILAKLRSMTEPDFLSLPDATEGLGYRLKNAVREGRSLGEIAELAKTKRYAMSRIRRMMICAYLGIKAERQNAAPTYARILGFNKRGRELLRELKKCSQIPIITRPAAIKSAPEQAYSDFMSQVRIDDLYAFGLKCGNNRPGEYDLMQAPVTIDCR